MRASFRQKLSVFQEHNVVCSAFSVLSSSLVYKMTRRLSSILSVAWCCASSCVDAAHCLLCLSSLSYSSYSLVFEQVSKSALFLVLLVYRVYLEL